jgi:hypothetical protein
VLRDFDKAGFTIAHTLQTDGRRYVFTHRPRVTDLGLRLADVRQNHLVSEEVTYGDSNPAANLDRNGADAQEMAFLCSGRREGSYVGRRVELNAFSSGALIAWIEGKLVERGIRKVVPDEEVLLRAYRLAYAQQLLRRRLRVVRQEVEAVAAGVALPEDLAAWVRGHLERHSHQPWDGAVRSYTRGQIEQADPPR